MVQLFWKTVWWFLTKASILLPCNPVLNVPWYLLKGCENLSPHRNLYTGVSIGFIDKCQNLEATKMSFNK